MVDWSAGDIARSALSVYSRCKPHLQEGRWTILAAIVLASEDTLHTISLGTGVKCLPADRLSLNGNDLHDSHAEVLARRGAIRWFMEEIQRCSPQFGVDSVWLERVSVGGRFRLREHVRAHLYISSLPCESIYYLCSCYAEALGLRERWRCFNTLPCMHAARWLHGGAQRFHCLAGFVSQLACSGTRQLFSPWRSSYKTWSA